MSDAVSSMQDVRFVLHEVLDVQRHLCAIGADITSADLDLILEEASTFSREVLAPLNASGDHEGARLAGSQVITPRGFREAYAQYRDNGWPGLSGDSKYGGQGLPASTEFPIGEMLSAANLAWRTYTGLNAGAVLALQAHGDNLLKQRYLPQLVTGEWLATMCLTEPQCGTDLALIRTRAQPRGDGSHEVTGTKMFVTGGDHDLTPNIVHLVLARLPGAPNGSRGISLFLVPKFEEESTAPRRLNGVVCRSIEHKMGIRGSATCVLEFDRSRGWLVGQLHGGLACMFTMMNHARLTVGVQGLGIADRAFQAAKAYARERRQGRSPLRETRSHSADPIIEHPDVRRMLLAQKSLVEGCRLLVYFIAMHMDRAQGSAIEIERQRSDELIALLTPIAKAFVTDAAVECASLAVQIHGGHGYIRETGVEQLLRDARILPIYEGTNGVQAFDLLNRKVLGDEARCLNRFIAELRATAAAHRADDVLGPFASRLDRSLDAWGELTEYVRTEAPSDPAAVAAAATDYLQFSGYVCLAWCWLRMAEVARHATASSAEAGLYSAKLDTAHFYFERMLPRAYAHASAVKSGSASLARIDPAYI